MRWKKFSTWFVIGITCAVAMGVVPFWGKLARVAHQGGEHSMMSSVMAAEDPCLQAKKLFNEASRMNDAHRERELLEKAAALQCPGDLNLAAHIHNNLGDAMERLALRDAALRNYCEAYMLLPYHETIQKNMWRLLEGLDEATVRRLCPVGRIQRAAELVAKLDTKTHRERLRSWRRIAVEPQGVPETSSMGQPQQYAAADSESLPPPPSGLSWLPTAIIYFDFDSNVLRPESEEQLRELRAALDHPAHKGGRFRLEGHTCDMGSETYNQHLSVRRAESVKKWLVQHGIDAQKLIVRGYGQSRPVAPNNDGTQHMNRRVQVVTVGTQVASRNVRGSTDWLGDDLERVAMLLEEGSCDEAEAILDRVESEARKEARADAKDRIDENRYLINMCNGKIW